MPTKFARQNYFPQGWQEVAGQFLKLFHRYGYIYKPLSGGSWFSADEKWKLTDSEILKAIACVHPKYILGTRAGKSTQFAVLDIDQGSRYHNQQSLDKLLQILSTAGLTRSSLYRSSYSGGWHLYLFFDEPINSGDLRRQLFKLLTLNDFHVKKGELEIFPNPGGEQSLGLGLRLPLQPGFAWLDKKTLNVDYERHQLTATKALEWFVDALEADANSYAAFRQLKTHVQELEARRQAATNIGLSSTSDNVVSLRRSEQTDHASEFIDSVRAIFQKLPPGILVDNWYRGRLYHLNGLTGPSQRAEAIECLSHYFFYGDPSRDLPAMGYGYEQEREWAIKQFLQVRHNGQSKDINRGRADALAQVERAAHWRPPHRKSNEPQKFRTQRPIAWIRENANRKTDARQRIKDALDVIKNPGRSFTAVDLQQAAACSWTTLYKHADIWRKDYEDLADGFFAISTHEYNVVVGAASSESKPPTTFILPDMPLERLAARQIASEISMRNARVKNRKEKAAINAQEASEKEWQSKVQPLLISALSEPDFKKLKSFIVLLMAYLAIAPTEEHQNWLQEKITLLKQRALKATLQLVSQEGRAPP